MMIRFREEVSDDHDIVVSSIHSEAFEWKMLAAHEFLDRTVVELLGAIMMCHVYDFIRSQKVTLPGVDKLLVKSGIRTDIGVHERIRANTAQERLLPLASDGRKDRSAEFGIRKVSFVIPTQLIWLITSQFCIFIQGHLLSWVYVAISESFSTL